MWKIIFLFALSFCAFALRVRGDEGETKIGDDCKVNEDCEDIDNSVCSSYDVCECSYRYVASSDNSTCLRLATKIGDECAVPEQCSGIPRAECKGNICVVAQAVTNSTATAKPKEECTEDSQCISFLVKRVCKNGACVLEPPSVAPIVPAVYAFLLNKACVNDSECSGEGTRCTDKMCKCVENFVPAQNLRKCLPKAKALGDSCVETAQCLPLNGSVCEGEKCTVLKRVFSDLAEKTISEKISSLLIGSSCQHDSECKHLSHALCLENVCQCQDDYITSITSNSCLKKAKKEGDPCSIDKQCEDVKGATCVQEKCVKPGVVGTKTGKTNSGASNTISKLALAVILFVKVFSV